MCMSISFIWLSRRKSFGKLIQLVITVGNVLSRELRSLAKTNRGYPPYSVE